MAHGKRPIRLCVRCDELGPHAAKGLCRRCYDADYSRSEVKRESRRRYDQTHSGEVARYRSLGGAKYRAAHGEELRAYNRQYQATHRERWKHDPRRKAVRAVAQARRRARERGLTNDLTTSQWEAILSAYDYRCAYCGQKAPKGEVLEQEHVVPITKGGPTTASNIVPACGRCNRSKGDRPPPVLPAVRLLL